MLIEIKMKHKKLIETQEENSIRDILTIGIKDNSIKEKLLIE